MDASTSTTLGVSNEYSGLDLLGKEGYELRYYPLVTSVCGLLTAFVVLFKIVTRAKGCNHILMLTQVVAVITACVFLASAPSHVTFDFESITLDRDVSIGLGPLIVLLCNAIGIILTIVAISGIDYASYGKRKSLEMWLLSAGFYVVEGRIVRQEDERMYGRMFGTYVRLYDLDMTHNPVAYKDVKGIRYNDGVMTIIYSKSDASGHPINTLSKSIGDVCTIQGRGRTIGWAS